MRVFTKTQDASSLFHTRLRIFSGILLVALLCLIIRLGYWQIAKGAELRAEAAQQYQRLIINQGHRGQILTADGFTLVDNQTVYDMYGQPPQLTQPADLVAKQLMPFLSPYVAAELKFAPTATQSTTPPPTLAQKMAELQSSIVAKLTKPQTKWVSLYKNISPADHDAMANLKIGGIAFEKASVRQYPEATLAAQITGFVGANDEGLPTGYFGIEGALNKELEGKQEHLTVEADAVGDRLGSGDSETVTQGRDVTLTIRRDMQYLAESFLAKGMERYGAKSGEIIIMEPQTGKIWAMASSPSYDPSHYTESDPQLYKNPSVFSAYEPGSTFKTLTVASGIDAGVISEDTQCPSCTGPRQIAGYTLRTWNDQYNPNITMTDALAKSDNTAMIFVSEKLGAEKFQSYLKKFGIDQPSHVELQEDRAPPFPTKWGPVELATRSFGQGISLTSLQLVKAINAIANQGKVMRPIIVDSVLDHATGQKIVTEPVVESQAVSAETAARVSQMMIFAARHGEAQWTASRTHEVAGKTGTAQIAVNGSYDSTKTIASFIGFTPVTNPKFIMLVKLVEPTSSPWAAETAAPLWYQLAEKLYLLLGIPPDFSVPSPSSKAATPTSSASPSATPDRPAVGD